MSYRRTRALFQKELRHIVRDVRSLIMALAMPLVLLLLFGYALNLDVDRVPTLVYDADGSPQSRELVERFRGSRFFDIVGESPDQRGLERAIDERRVLLGLAIPRDYAQRLNAGRTAEIQALLDGSDSNTAEIALGYVETLARAYSFEVRAAAQNQRGGLRAQTPLEAQVRVWYNSTLQSRNYVVPGLIAVILMIIAALLTSLTVAREWEMGTMEQLLSTPARPAEIVLGKMLAFFLVGVADTVVAVLVAVFVFDVPFRGELWLLGLASGVFLSGALFWGIFISAVAKSQLLAFQMGLLSSFLPAFLLSGFVYATENMPPVIQAITYVVPARYFVTILKGVFLKGVGLNVLWPPILLLVVYAAVVFVAATRKLSQKLA
jgi:ABC-2 type transport system permease protein